MFPGALHESAIQGFRVVGFCRGPLKSSTKTLVLHKDSISTVYCWAALLTFDALVPSRGPGSSETVHCFRAGGSSD